jgi:hypothetical protein
MPQRRPQPRRRSEKPKAGSLPIPKLTLLNTRASSRLWRTSSTPSCRRSTAKVELLEVPVSLEVQDSPEELDSLEVLLELEDNQDPVSMKLIDE